MALDLDRVRQIAERVAGSNGLEVVEVEVSGAGKHRALRVFIDRPGAAPAAIARRRDTRGLLEVQPRVWHDRGCRRRGARRIVCAGGSSPGLDRKLTKASDFERFRGQRVKLMTREPVNGNRHFEGKLESFENGKLLLDLSAARKKKMRPKEGDAAKVEIEFKNVEKANLVPEI